MADQWLTGDGKIDMVLEGLQKYTRKLFWDDSMFIIFIVVMVSQLYTSVKFFTFYILNRCNLLYVNYMIIQLSKKF